MGHKKKLYAKEFEHKLIFGEGESVYNLKKDLNKIPDNSKFNGVEPYDEFGHEVIIKFIEKRYEVRD